MRLDSALATSAASLPRSVDEVALGGEQRVADHEQRGGQHELDPQARARHQAEVRGEERHQQHAGDDRALARGEPRQQQDDVERDQQVRAERARTRPTWAPRRNAPAGSTTPSARGSAPGSCPPRSASPGSRRCRRRWRRSARSCRRTWRPGSCPSTRRRTNPRRRRGCRRGPCRSTCTSAPASSVRMVLPPTETLSPSFALMSLEVRLRLFAASSSASDGIALAVVVDHERLVARGAVLVEDAGEVAHARDRRADLLDRHERVDAVQEVAAGAGHVADGVARRRTRAAACRACPAAASSSTRSKTIGTSTLPAFFTLAARRTSLFSATDASERILPISATSPGGCAPCAAGVCAADRRHALHVGGERAGIRLVVDVEHLLDVGEAGILLRLEEEHGVADHLGLARRRAGR